MDIDDSPIVERRSRKIAPADLVVENVAPEDFNDDEEERNQLRIQEESNRRSHSIHSKRMSLADKSISDKNVSEHFRSCIQLAAENKITAKNAFNFKLIDLLYTMLKKKEEQFKNFSEVTSSLDAGVKIYSCRVDNVHADTMKMATSVSVASCEPNEDKSSAGDVNEGDLNRHERRRMNRKPKKFTLVTNVNQINRSSNVVEEGISQKILTNETLIMNNAIFDTNNVSWHLDTSLNFWKSIEHTSRSGETVSADLPDIPQDTVICKTFDHFKFGDEANNEDLNKRDEIFNAYEYEPVADTSSTDANDALPMDDDFETSEQITAEKAPEIAYFSKIMSSSDFVNDISQLISSEKSEYLYFNSQALNKTWRLRNMKHWNPFKKKKEPEERRSRAERKEKISFKDLSGLDVFDKGFGAATSMNVSASRDKLLLTPITHFSVNEFFRLKIWREMFVIPSKNINEDQPADLDETIKDYNYDNPHDSQNFIPEQYEDDYCDVENSVTSDVHEAIEKNTFIGDNLLEIPNKVSKIQLPYMVKDKSVNMKNLKARIWNKLETPTANILSQINKDSASFSNVCKVILVDESKKTDEELTVPILFNAILQLANDKCLYLFNPTENDVTDFMVTVSSSVQ
ncbi:hypothetical protein V9T40_003009 [Parthenolecanium corni]|uniref:Condensin complex subunit 2 n=1 Tax=Parthenolecanium corni TaxID=536013 RepID=A0AAN9TUI9_9HEMI